VPDPQDILTPLMLDNVVDIAKQAGDLGVEYQAKAALDKWEKTPGDPVSEADIALDNLLRDKLLALASSIGWGSEESHDDSRIGNDWVWLVDPIDGTRSFIKGEDYWGVSIALAYKGDAVLAVVHAPVIHKTWTALRGHGAHLNGRPVKISHTTDLNQAVMGGDIAGFRHKLWPVKWPDDMRGHPIGALALRLCEMTAPQHASPAIDCCASLRPKNDWDIAAAALVLAECGATLSCADGSPLIFNTPSLSNDGLIASNEALYDQLLTRMAPAQARIKERGLK